MTEYQEIHDKVFLLLHTQLPSFLAYHSPKHTAYVIEQAELISRHEDVDDRDLLLIKTAALFHDIGFVKQYKDHEEAGCDITREFLNEYSFRASDTDLICAMIMTTKIPQTPTTLNEKIVCDADLEYLGTDLFHKVSQFLFKEMHYLDPELDLNAFNQLQVNFISAHTYHTEYCRKFREEKKLQNLKELKESM